jgi:excisionase family DNA binding protein
MTSDKVLLTVAEAAELLSLGRSKVYEEIACGRLVAVKVGRARRVPRWAVDAYVKLLTRDVDCHTPKANR